VNVRLIERMPYEDAMRRLAQADLGLGIFGQSAKSARVVPHKVFQSMALGVPTITRRSAAIAEFFRDEEHLVLVPPGDGAALARAIEALADDPARRERIGAQGRAAALSQASPPRIGELLEEAIRRAL
jgi:glycosyltransferase involved in cell wall biosynthesis